jgi:hypothetical protein
MATYRIFQSIGGKRRGIHNEALADVEASSARQALLKFRREWGHRGESRKLKAMRLNPSKRSVRKRVAAALKKYVRGNPARVKGRKVTGGRAVTVRNFTGTIVKKSDGTVDILGKGKRR